MSNINIPATPKAFFDEIKDLQQIWNLSGKSSSRASCVQIICKKYGFSSKNDAVNKIKINSLQSQTIKFYSYHGHDLRVMDPRIFSNI